MNWNNIGHIDNNHGHGEAYLRATTSVENGGDVICNRPEANECSDLADNRKDGECSLCGNVHPDHSCPPE